MLHLLNPQNSWAVELAEAIISARQTVRPCPECGFFSDTGGLCAICSDSTRDSSILCVVETAQDVLTFERSGAYRGLYHCLGGKISPLDGISAEDLAIPQLLKRANKENVREIILALGSDVEGETTTLLLQQELAPLGKKVSRLARGLAVGTGLESADPITLAHALNERKVASAR